MKDSASIFIGSNLAYEIVKGGVVYVGEDNINDYYPVPCKRYVCRGEKFHIKSLGFFVEQAGWAPECVGGLQEQRCGVIWYAYRPQVFMGRMQRFRIARTTRLTIR